MEMSVYRVLNFILPQTDPKLLLRNLEASLGNVIEHPSRKGIKMPSYHISQIISLRLGINELPEVTWPANHTSRRRRIQSPGLKP